MCGDPQVENHSLRLKPYNYCGAENKNSVREAMEGAGGRPDL